MTHRRSARLLTILVVAIATMAACAPKKPAATPQPAPPSTGTEAAPTAPAAPPRAPQRVDDLQPVPEGVLREDTIANRSLDDLNRDSPFKPAFFGLDSSDLDDTGRAVVAANAELLKRYPTWLITIEGHCDERGTAEYNLALGERRAIAVKTYLVGLGIAADRLRTVSYGKEFPFDTGHTESAWAANRRAHFVITSK